MMYKSYRFGGLLVALLLNTNVYAGDFQVEGGWSRATAPGQDAASVDLTITSKQPATLVGVSSPASKSAELHSMTHVDGMMKMREVTAIELPAGKHVNLAESGYHLMLIRLKAPLKAGKNIPLTLTIKLADKSTVKVEAKAEVKPLTAIKDMMHDHQHQHEH